MTHNKKNKCARIYSATARHNFLTNHDAQMTTTTANNLRDNNIIYIQTKTLPQQNARRNPLSAIIHSANTTHRAQNASMHSRAALSCDCKCKINTANLAGEQFAQRCESPGELTKTELTPKRCVDKIYHHTTSTSHDRANIMYLTLEITFGGSRFAICPRSTVHHLASHRGCHVTSSSCVFGLRFQYCEHTL